MHANPSHNDKRGWVRDGVAEESPFLTRYGRALGLVANPARQGDRYAIDLMRPCDHKRQGTWFPKYPRCITLNVKDVVRYELEYGDCDVYFDVCWPNPFGRGIWQVALRDVLAMRARCVLHWYKDRPAPRITDENLWYASVKTLEPFRMYAGQGEYYSPFTREGDNGTCSYVLPLMRPLVFRLPHADV